jgi:hypothetical protein
MADQKAAMTAENRIEVVKPTASQRFTERVMK